MNIGFVSTRLAGTDGVSLEVEKWAHVLERMGHQVFFCAGELDGYAAAGQIIPKLHFQHPQIADLSRRAFEVRDEDPQRLLKDIWAAAEELESPLRSFIDANQINLLIVQNAFAIPMNLPLGAALGTLIRESGIPAIAHNHDYFWERGRFQASPINAFLDTYFPPNLPNVQHVSINSIARGWLKARRGIESKVVPNVHDFASPPVETGASAADIRQALGLQEGEPFILQPTRVIRRKGIELALLLVKSLGLQNPALYITHGASDEGPGYWNWLKKEADVLGIQLRKIDEMVGAQGAGSKPYSLWDIYPHADLVTYPSLYEGFGNALLEAVYYKRPVVVNRYPVYNADIAPLGFDFIELDGFVSEDAVQQTREALSTPEKYQMIAQQNYKIAKEAHSLEVLENKLRSMIEKFSS